MVLIVFGLNHSLLGVMRKLAKQRLAVDQKLMAATAEPIFGAEVAKLLGLEDSLTRRLRKPLRRLAMNSVLQAVIKKGPTSFVEFVIVAGVAVVLAVMWHFFAMPLGQALPIIGTFALISARLLMVLASLLYKRLDVATIVPSLTIVRAALEKQDALRRSEEGAHLRSIEGDIEFRNVAFSYSGDQEIFKDLNMVIPKGKLTALVGPSGVGKSTLGYLVARMFEPEAGEICINGRNIREFSVASLRARIGYVEQTPVIFNGTFSENIRLGASDASDEAVEAAAVAAGIHDFIISLPKGYDSAIEDQGATLSGGQRQRVALARALVRRPDLYIIDEGTSSLDRALEAVVLATMRSVANTATVLFITHRIASTECADLIYEFERGEAVLREFHEVA
jgi:ABC-type multidrug transport system fused ATPase/permease subunit